MKTPLNIIVSKTDEFVKKAFIANPHYSFGHWSVMYEHSVRVKELALKIAKNIDCDRELLAVGSLLHDIGKTKRAEPAVLHTEHEKYNLEVSEALIESFDISADALSKLKDLISFRAESTESRIVRDADALALCLDKRLYMLFIEWAVNETLYWTIHRKINKYSKLNFEVSKIIGKQPLAQMRQDWNDYLKLRQISLVV